MTDKEKIADAAKNGWMKDHYRIYKSVYYQHFGNYVGCLSYKNWLASKIDLYKPDLYKKYLK